MPIFQTPSITVTPSEFIEACTPRDIDKVIEILKEDFDDELTEHIHPSVEKFLDDCNHFEREEAYESLKNDYDFVEDFYTPNKFSIVVEFYNNGVTIYHTDRHESSLNINHYLREQKLERIVDET